MCYNNIAVMCAVHRIIHIVLYPRKGNNNKEEIMNKNITTRKLTIAGLLSALLFIMAYTPLGYLNIGPLAVTLNVIPVAVAAVALGPIGGAVVGGVFGLTSFLQCFGASVLGTAIMQINPALTAVQCFVPRIIDGFLTGFIAEKIKNGTSGMAGMSVASFTAGFLAAFLNTLFYMTSLMLLFGNSEIIQSYWNKKAPGKNVFLFVIAFVGVNAVTEMITSTVITGAVGTALSGAKLISREPKSAEA